MNLARLNYLPRRPQVLPPIIEGPLRECGYCNSATGGARYARVRFRLLEVKRRNRIHLTACRHAGFLPGGAIITSGIAVFRVSKLHNRALYGAARRRVDGDRNRDERISRNSILAWIRRKNRDQILVGHAIEPSNPRFQQCAIWR